MSDNALKKVLFFGANSSYSHSMLSYAYIRAFSDKYLSNWNWRYLETVTAADPMETAVEIDADRPDVIIATAYLFNIEFLLKTLCRIKALSPCVPVILGGPEFLGDNAAFLQSHPEVDAVIRGDESSVYTVLENIADRSVWGDIPGLCMYKGGEYIDNGVARFEGEFDDMPSPYRDDLLPKGKSFVQLETSRGCSGGCTFCAGPMAFKTMHHGLDRVKGDLSNIKNAGFKEVRVLDRTFNRNTSRFAQLLELFKSEFAGINFHLEINPARLDVKQIEILKNMPPGLLHVEAGIQSLDDQVLHAVKRPATSSTTLKGLEALCNMNHFELHTDLIAGLPMQTLESILEDVTKLVEVGPDEIQLEILKMLPGTPLRNDPPVGLRYSPDTPYEVLATNNMSPEDIICARHISVILESYYNAPVLRPVFRFATLCDPEFPAKFLAEAEKLFSNTAARPSMGARFNLFEQYAKDDFRLLDLIKFAHLAAADSPSKYDLKLHKSTPEMFNYTKSASEMPKRYCETEFAWNVDEIYSDPRCEIKDEPRRIRFFRYQSGHPGGCKKI